MNREDRFRKRSFRIKHETLAFELTPEQTRDVAERLNVSVENVEDVLDAMNDTFLSDPVGTIRRSTDGTWIAARQNSLDEPYDVYCAGRKGGSHMSDPNLSIMKWPIIYPPELVEETRHRIGPSPDGRNDLADQVEVLAHHSALHDGINVEIDAPAGTRITVHFNDGDLADIVVPE